MAKKGQYSDIRYTAMAQSCISSNLISCVHGQEKHISDIRYTAMAEVVYPVILYLVYLAKVNILISGTWLWPKVVYQVLLYRVYMAKKDQYSDIRYTAKAEVVYPVLLHRLYNVYGQERPIFGYRCTAMAKSRISSILVSCVHGQDQ